MRALDNKNDAKNITKSQRVFSFLFHLQTTKRLAGTFCLSCLLWLNLEKNQVNPWDLKNNWQLLQKEPKSHQNGKDIAKNTRSRQKWPNRFYAQGSSSKRAKKRAKKYPKWTKVSKYGKKSSERAKNRQKEPKMFTCNAAPRAEVVSFVSLNMPGSSSKSWWIRPLASLRLTKRSLGLGRNMSEKK